MEKVLIVGAEYGQVGVVLIWDCKKGTYVNDHLKMMLDIRSCEPETILDEVIRLSRRGYHCGIVEHAEMSVGFNYDDWIIIQAT
ncbi:hypothetical protein P8452_51672 [Trifolium repens]|nr:hypothetical protein P8452_51672 [Trifolium repens]